MLISDYCLLTPLTSPEIKLECKLMGVLIISTGLQRNGILAPDPCGKITRRLLDICNIE